MKHNFQKLIKDLYNPKRKKDLKAAINSLNLHCLDYYDDLVLILRSPEYDQEWYIDKRYPIGPVKELIFDALLQNPSEKLIKDISFLIKHPDPYIRKKFAHKISEIGELYAIELVEIALNDTEENVRAYATYGLRNRAKTDYNDEFANKAADLLYKNIIKYPNDKGGPRHEAIKIYDPERYKRIEVELDREDPLKPIFRQIYSISDKFKSHKDAITGFEGYPLGFKYLYCLSFIDSDIRNGGIYQFYSNSTLSFRMKKLRKIALDLDRECWGNDYRYKFYLRSRCLCNFIERKIKKDKIELVDSTKLVITGCETSESYYRVNSSKIACFTVLFDKASYDKLHEDVQIHNFIVNFAKSSIRFLPESRKDGIDAILALINEFEECGFVNQWTHQTKKLRKYKIKATLECSLTLESFQLKLRIICDEKEVFSKVILQTDPDELAFHYKFKDIKIENNILVVTSRVGNNLFEIPLEELLKLNTP